MKYSEDMLPGDLPAGSYAISSPDRPPPRISVVSPVFQAQNLVAELIRQLVVELEAMSANFEILLVDDGSQDESWLRIAEAAASDRRVKGLRLARNFGQHAAITAGLDAASGQWVVVMDCDLQDDPRYIAPMFARAAEGYDVVYAVKSQRRHGKLKNLGGRVFASALNWLGSSGRADANIGAYSLLSRRAVDAFRSMREVHRHYLGVLRWLNLPSVEVVVEHRDRPDGASSYTAGRLIRHGIAGLAAHSDRLLYVGLGGAVLFGVAGLISAVWLVAGYYLHGYREGWTSTMVLVLLSNSVTLFAVGTVGVYVARIFEQVKQRPLYLTRERINL